MSQLQEALDLIGRGGDLSDLIRREQPAHDRIAVTSIIVGQRVGPRRIETRVPKSHRLTSQLSLAARK